MQAAAKIKNIRSINNTDKYVPFVSSHMHSGIHRCVGETLVQIMKKGITESLQRATCLGMFMCIHVCMGERAL